jgi:hypothetical protein
MGGNAMSETPSGEIVQINSHHVDAWPEVREALGLNPGGPDLVDGVKVINVEKGDYGHITLSVTLHFESAESLANASKRLFNEAEEMFAYGIEDDAADVRDFASYALPTPTEMFPDAE